MTVLDVGRVLASPLARAVDTAATIARALDVPHAPDPRFTDRDYGPWTGHLRQEVVDRFGSVDAAPGVEPTGDVVLRVRPALDAVLEEESGTVAIVTHDAVIRPLLVALDPRIGSIRAPNGSWNELIRTDTGWHVPQFDRQPADGRPSAAEKQIPKTP
ncbi:histidine phosphatase family protein [uncultured Amnibacterium sp.]|uniref:histidine phosphatase family protein n=1 Tax=uncultured Amnibacterium sp. TaxID=1631851 RepID=UPI0035CA19CF